VTSIVSAPLSPNARLRYDVLQRLLEPIEDARSFLEIGCGQGGLATLLAEHFDYVAYEPDTVSFGVARDRLRRIGRGHVFNQPLPDHVDRTYEIVGAFEVLEHMEDDVATLGAWVRWIAPGGHLLLSVPAHPKRFGPGDEYGGHFRRYTRRGLESILTEAGLINVEILIYGFPLGYLLESTRNRILARRMKAAPASPMARTAGSGRILQLSGRLAPLVWAATLPFRYMQRPFERGNLGIGFVVRAERKA
jgi:SAM-dependent methyltransferase